MIQAGVLGAAGFAGVQLAHILAAHPDMELAAIASDSLKGIPPLPVSLTWPSVKGMSSFE